MILRKQLSLDYLVVVAGGDCHNALVDGQKVALKGLRTFYLFYPFEDDPNYLKGQFDKLSNFLGGIQDPELFERVNRIKKTALNLDKRRVEGKISPAKAFGVMVSLSDLRGDLTLFEKILEDVKDLNVDYTNRVALVGILPIYYDFHDVLGSLGLHAVYDELPYEFARLSGNNINELASNYCNYTFARDLKFRLNFLKKELKKRKVDGIIHYTQYACHHLLEDDILRERLGYPFLTIQGDLPGETPKQALLRLEAFSEMLAGL